MKNHVRKFGERIDEGFRKSRSTGDYGVSESRSTDRTGNAQEKWDEIVRQIDELGEELQSIFDEISPDSETLGAVENSLMGLRMAVDDLREQEIPAGDGEDLGFPGQMFPGPTRM